MERAYWVAWKQIKDVGPVLIKRLYERFGSLAVAWQAPPADLLTVDGIGLVIADQISQLRSQLNPHQLLEQHEAHSPNFWTPADPDYPSLLWEIPDPPPVLYYRGPLRPNRLPAITLAIVGTRRPSPYGQRWTQRLSRRCSQQQIAIVSGMAAGIDTYAHQSCLHNRGQTIAVLGTGVDIIYPRRNEQLYHRILETGLIVSEYPNGTPPERSHFPQRNRIIAGLSHATLVTEAPQRSGALITAYLANDYGRHVYALPGGLDNPTSLGCLVLINTGAAMVMGENQLIQDLLNIGAANTGAANPDAANPGAANPDAANTAVDTGNTSPVPIEQTLSDPPSNVIPAAITENENKFSELDVALQPIFQLIPTVPISLDTLVETTQLDTSVLLSGLLQLEIAGFVVQLPGGRYQRT